MIAKILELFPAATHDEIKKLCFYLKLSNNERKFALFYRQAQEIFDLKKEREPYEWAHFYAHHLYPLSLKIIATHLPIDERQTFLQEHHMRADQLEHSIQKIQSNSPFLSSEDLRLAGIPNNKQMGVLLKEGERLAINESLVNPQDIIERLKTTPLWKPH